MIWNIRDYIKEFKELKAHFYDLYRDYYKTDRDVLYKSIDPYLFEVGTKVKVISRKELVKETGVIVDREYIKTSYGNGTPTFVKHYGVYFERLKSKGSFGEPELLKVTN